MRTYLRIGTDTLEEAQQYASKKAAVEAFAETAHQLARFGQSIEASLHYANSMDELAEYPDFVLSITARGSIKCERC